MVLLYNILDVEDLTLELGRDEVLLLFANILQEVLRPLRLTKVIVDVLDVLHQIRQPFILILQCHILEHLFFCFDLHKEDTPI